MNTTDTIEGGCQCGRVRYRVRPPLPPAWACHCRECQKQSGGAGTLSISVAAEDFEVEGEMAAYDRPAESGATTTGFFCPHCGARLFHRSSRSAARLTLKAGNLDDTSGLTPVCHLWVSRKQPWVVLDPALPAYDTQPADLKAWREELIR